VIQGSNPGSLLASPMPADKAAAIRGGVVRDWRAPGEPSLGEQKKLLSRRRPLGRRQIWDTRCRWSVDLLIRAPQSGASTTTSPELEPGIIACAGTEVSLSPTCFLCVGSRVECPCFGPTSPRVELRISDALSHLVAGLLALCRSSLHTAEEARNYATNWQLGEVLGID